MSAILATCMIILAVIAAVHIKRAQIYKDKLWTKQQTVNDLREELEFKDQVILQLNRLLQKPKK